MIEWRLSWRNDPVGRQIADRHYNPCPGSGGRYSKSAGPVIVCPACGSAVRLYRGQIPNHQRRGNASDTGGR